ncbi:YqzL family protein [Alkaliphilus serpentinus]|nr:hypothetical protein [Alkaliphilus serpentinus]
MLRKEIWNIFIKTGNIEAYLFENTYCQQDMKANEESDLERVSNDK